ncbi:MAG: tyrosine-type recombinase/integrase [Pseudomonadota bacterium]
MANADDTLDWQLLPVRDDLALALQDWRSWLAHERRLSAHTCRAYGADIIDFLQFMAGHQGGALALNHLTAIDLRAFRSWLAHRAQDGATAATRARNLSALRSLFGWLDSTGRGFNPAIGQLQAPKRKAPLPRPVAEIDAHAMLTMAEELASTPWLGLRDRALLTLLYGGGLRIGEAVALNRDRMPAVADNASLLVDGKGGKQRQIPLLPAIMVALARYIDACPYDDGGQGPLFFGAKGGRLNADTARGMVRQIRAGLQLPDSVTPHALRHSFASHLLAEDVDLRVIQDLLGHASLASTQRYLDADMQRLQAVYNQAHPRSGKSRKDS